MQSLKQQSFGNVRGDSEKLYKKLLNVSASH